MGERDVQFLRRKQEYIGPWRRARNPRLRVHPYRRYQDSRGRVVWRRYAVRRDNWQSAVSTERRWLWNKCGAYLPVLRTASKGGGTTLPVNGHSCPLVRRWQGAG